MREIWVADAETDPFDGRSVIEPFIWGCYNGSEYHEFRHTADFVAFISERDCIVYGHNAGRFDWHFILKHLAPFSSVMVVSGRLAKFTIGRAEFRDSYNILPAPLSAYKKDEIDYSKFTRKNREKFMPEIREYLRNDCLYLYQFVSAFIYQYGLNLTFASAAMKMWQKIENVKAPKTDADFYATFSPYYYGGRVEAFRTGIIQRKFLVIDINSAYPFAMLHYHPYGSGFEDGCALATTDAEIALQFISVRCASLGAFPFRNQDLSLWFPDDGELRTFHITGHEYLAARDCGLLKRAKVVRTLTLRQRIKFNTYIHHFYALKLAAKAKRDDKTLDQAIRDQAARDYEFAKFFLNGLYGKFCANPEEYCEYMVIDPVYIASAMQAEGWDFAGQLGDFALMSKALPESQQHYYNLATGASITGFVRAYLLRALSQCRGVLYCDTDSIAAESIGDITLNDAELGAWSHVMDSDYAAIGGKKLYAFRDVNGADWKIATKGAKLTPAEVVRVAKGETVEYEPLAPTFSVTGRNDIEKVFFPQSRQTYVKRRISRT